MRTGYHQITLVSLSGRAGEGVSSLNQNRSIRLGGRISLPSPEHLLRVMRAPRPAGYRVTLVSGKAGGRGYSLSLSLELVSKQSQIRREFISTAPLRMPKSTTATLRFCLRASLERQRTPPTQCSCLRETLRNSKHNASKQH